MAGPIAEPWIMLTVISHNSEDSPLLYNVSDLSILRLRLRLRILTILSPAVMPTKPYFSLLCANSVGR